MKPRDIGSRSSPNSSALAQAEDAKFIVFAAFVDESRAGAEAYFFIPQKKNGLRDSRDMEYLEEHFEANPPPKCSSTLDHPFRKIHSQKINSGMLSNMNLRMNLSVAETH